MACEPRRFIYQYTLLLSANCDILSLNIVLFSNRTNRMCVLYLTVNNFELLNQLILKAPFSIT